MMFFGRKTKCKRCSSKLNDNFSFCPYCGAETTSKEKEARDFGMLGRNDAINERITSSFLGNNFSITDKMINSLVNSMMKSLNRQFKEINNFDKAELNNAEIQHFPNGVKIRIGMPSQIKKQAPNPKQVQKTISEAQIKKMSKLPRAEAKAKIKRLSNKVIYELTTPGLISTDDVFISRLESGYEIKALAKKKVFVNTLPITLPLKGILLDNNKLLVEFKAQ